MHGAANVTYSDTDVLTKLGKYPWMETIVVLRDASMKLNKLHVQMNMISIFVAYTQLVNYYMFVQLQTCYGLHFIPNESKNFEGKIDKFGPNTA